MYEIIDIKWERANLILKLNKMIDDTVYLVKGMTKIELPYKDDEIRISIYNVPEGSSIDQGKWHIEIGEVELPIEEEKGLEKEETENTDDTSETLEENGIKINPKLVNVLDDKSRIFKYRNSYALLITFSINSSFSFYITADYMMKNRKYKKYYRYAEKKKFKNKVIQFARVITIYILNLIYRIIYMLSRKNKVLFLTENMDELNSNLKYLYEYLKPRYKTRVYAKDIYKGKKNIFKTIVQKNKELFALARSKYVFVDNYTSLLTIIKPVKSQVISQLWHAGVGFKAVGYARFGKSGSPHPFIAGHRKYNYAFVDKEELIDVYKEVFGAKTEIFNISGMPRLDGFTDKNKINETIKSIYSKVPMLENKKIILFSPTYRGNGSKDAYYDYTKLDLDKINKYCEDNEFVFVVKMHPFIKEKLEIPEEYKNNIIDLSDMDINELIYITDIMITDYSSCAYEYSYFNRPLVFYRYDKDLYEYLRPMHTLDFFTEEQYEATDFESLMNVLDKLKNINIEDRFNNINERNTNSCEIIEKIVFKGDKHGNTN